MKTYGREIDLLNYDLFLYSLQQELVIKLTGK